MARTCSRIGFLCPKGVSLQALHEDPDRLRSLPAARTARWRRPRGRTPSPASTPACAGSSSAAGATRSRSTWATRARTALAVPLNGRALLKALGTRNVYSASTVDQFPKQLSTALMFGGPILFPVPDLDRTDWLMMFGANPRDPTVRS